MKHFIFLLTILVGYNLSGQSVNGIPFSEVDSEYVEIIGTPKGYSTSFMILNIRIDLGRKYRDKKTNRAQIKDENDKLIVFETMVDALNFLHAYGYELVDENTDSLRRLMRKVKD